MRKKITQKVSGLMAAILLAGSLFIPSGEVNAATVNDLGKSSEYSKEAIQWMAGKDIIVGDKKGNFEPRKEVSRAELVTLLVKALGIDISNLPGKASFTDVPANHWAYKYVEAAARAGIVSGIGNGKFGVEEQSTREQVTTMLMNYLSVSKEAVLAGLGLGDTEKFKDESKMSEWAKAPIQLAISNKLMVGVSSELFSPKGTATKEQIAVILYKFLNSKDTVLKNIEELKKPIVAFNGDILKLTTAPEVINGEMFVPSDVFTRIGAEVKQYETDKLSIKSSSDSNKNIYLNTDSKTAYVNYTGTADPFADPAAQDKLIALDNAPKKSGDEVLVPVKAVAEAIGVNAEWNSKTNLVSIQDSKSVKNPVLLNALKSLLQYNGEYNTGMNMTMTETNSNEDFKVSYTMNGAINGDNSTSKTKFSMSYSGQPDENLEYETVNLNNKIYSKDAETGIWSMFDPEEATEEGIMYYDVVSDRAETQKLINSFGKLNIVPAGKAAVNGEEVLKYKVKISNELMKDLLPAEFIESGLDINEIYNKGLDFKIDMYVNNKGQLVKQAATAAGGMEYECFGVNLLIRSDIEYSNIGKDIEIKNPLN